MSVGIDDETEWASGDIFGTWHKIAPLLGRMVAFPAECGDHFGHARTRVREDGGNDHPIAGMRVIEKPAGLFPGLARIQHATMDCFPRVRPAIADRVAGDPALVSGEEIRESQRDDRPFGIFFVPRGLLAKRRMDPQIASIDR